MDIIFSHQIQKTSLYVAEKIQHICKDDENRYIQDFEKEFYNSVHNSRKREFLSVRKLLHTVFPQKKHIIQYSKSGKPECSEYSISISHSHNYIAIICTPNKQVSIDIEEYRNIIEKTAPKFISEQEKKCFQSIEELTLVWSSKEVLYKLFEASSNFLQDYTIEGEKQDLQEHGKLIGRVNTKKIDKTIKIDYFRSQKFIVTWSIVDSK
ncbi:MAG: hypothetical protein PF481_08755 [Bacteroidales bacterium]|jgi:4'-phosphopantetheinyl transferase|nr:hypothetical protein [Bacteroidales bacterium]